MHAHTGLCQELGFNHICFSRSHAGTGTLISHQGRMWLLTANSVLKPSEAPLDDLLLYFGYINKDKQGAYLSAKDLLDTKEWHSHPVHVSTQ